MGSQGGTIQEPKNAPLAREGSLYNLTLDEVQNQLGNLGKPLGSMNLDELLKSVWSVDASDASGLDFGGDANMQHGQVASGSSLNPQGSLTLCGDLSKKTVDEVWRDMQLKKSTNMDRKVHERQPTLGEMTLEDFLVKAGVAAESFPTKDGAMEVVDSNGASQQNVSQHGHWMQYQLPSVQQPLQQHQHQNQQKNLMGGFVAGHAIQQPFQVAVSPILDATYSEAMVTMSPSSLIGTLSDTQTPGRKRVASGNVVEKTVERRQKRMIKNRESAARSRARKQAYTQELEIKVSHLEEENERLRKQNQLALV
ncbi:ABSCISIC ACID-INSENSITIVE 5-like protein 2 isoform X2 [Gastrolobium bilobum]|uniref:ABSCISIC ACID-INSENSITIVE 5-like protein 2 isoform X2 n=1 Tax=Gastrolobium bilobum TaxID=150636 RepID=UPI002AB04B9F|nr:ABSCISIC ACID-INSENSITIVE 5-like protein 2 isoform X2 [Gastrolobium bilobum]